MTPTQGEHAQPEALRLADAIDPFTRQGAPDHLTSKVAADHLRALHAQVAAQPAAPQGGAYVENPVEIEHVAGDESKNRAESNMAQQPAPSAAAAPDDWKIPQPEVGGSAVPVTQEDVDAAREKVLWCLGSALLSGSDREARKALNDRHVLYSLLGDANCRLVGSIAPQPSPTPQADSVTAPAAGPSDSEDSDADR